MAGLNTLTPDERPPLLAGVPLLWLHRLPAPRDHASAHALQSRTQQHYQGHLPEDARLAPLSSSLAYADNFLLLGLCCGANIGIDLVRITPMPDWQTVATLYLGPHITAELAGLPAEQRDAAFARHWAELEARGKCLGIGLQEYSPAHATRLHADDIQLLPVDVGQPQLVAALAIRL